jgi:hypothetical protein
MVPAAKPTVAVPKLTSSASVMMVLAVAPLPAGSVPQKALVPQVPLAVPKPGVPEPSVSQ